MSYPDPSGRPPAGGWTPAPGWPPAYPASQPPVLPTAAQYPTPPIPGTAPTGRSALTAGAALSFVTGVSMALGGTISLLSLVTASTLSSALGGYGRSSSTTSAVTAIVVVVLVALGLAFLLFWGGLEAALGRRVGIAVVGNLVAIVLVIIAATQSSGFVLLMAVVPVLATLCLSAGRPALRPA